MVVGCEVPVKHDLGMCATIASPRHHAVLLNCPDHCAGTWAAQPAPPSGPDELDLLVQRVLQEHGIDDAELAAGEALSLWQRWQPSNRRCQGAVLAQTPHPPALLPAGDAAVAACLRVATEAHLVLQQAHPQLQQLQADPANVSAGEGPASSGGDTPRAPVNAASKQAEETSAHIKRKR